MNSKEILSSLVEKGVLVSPDLFEKHIDEETLKEISKTNLDYLDEKFLKEFQEAKKNNIEKKHQNQNNLPKIRIIQSYNVAPKKRTFQDFVSLFNNRYNNISIMLKNRQEMSGTTSISRLKTKNQNTFT